MSTHNIAGKELDGGAGELVRRSSFTMSELKAAIEDGNIRWMSKLETDIREYLPEETVFEFLEEENNPAYVARRFRSVQSKVKASATISMLTGDTGTDCIVYLCQEL